MRNQINSAPYSSKWQWIIVIETTPLVYHFTRYKYYLRVPEVSTDLDPGSTRAAWRRRRLRSVQHVNLNVRLGLDTADSMTSLAYDVTDTESGNEQLRVEYQRIHLRFVRQCSSHVEEHHVTRLQPTST